MARQVVSVLHAPSGSPRASEPALEANAYAVAEDIELTLVLRGRGVEFAQRASLAAPIHLAGRALPDAAAGSDLRGLLESGVRILVGEACMRELGMDARDLLDGIRIVGEADLADVLRSADAVLTW